MAPSWVVYFDQTNEPSAEKIPCDIQGQLLRFGTWPKDVYGAGSFCCVVVGFWLPNPSGFRFEASNEAQLAQLLLAAASGDVRVGVTLGVLRGGG